MRTAVLVLLGIVSITLICIVAAVACVNNPAVSNFIVTGRSQQLYSAIETGGPYGMRTLDQSLRALLEQELIDERVARALSRN